MQPRSGAPDVPIPSSSALRIEKVRGNLYVLRGGGRTVRIGGVDIPQAGTTAVFVTATGVVVVDTKLPGWGEPLLESVREITDRPVTTVINTHTHMDHVGGNVDLPSSVDIVAHENTARLMTEMRPVSGGPAQPDVFRSGKGLPTRTFHDRLTIGSGDDRIELYYFGRAHTSGDAWVVFPGLHVVHAGDAFPGKGVPPLDANNGASGIEYAHTLASAIASLPDVETVITGHYHTTLTLADLKVFGAFVREFVDAVQAAKRDGGTVDEFVAAWRIPDKYSREGYASMEHLRSIRSDVEVIWNETK